LSAGNTAHVPSDPFCAHPLVGGLVVVVVVEVVVLEVVVLEVVVVEVDVVVVVDFGGFPRAGVTAPVTSPVTVMSAIAPAVRGTKKRRKRRRISSYRHPGPEILKRRSARWSHLR
jgi:hypothetical protein